jgi:hypothetical protein
MLSDHTAGAPGLPALPMSTVRVYGKKIMIIMPWSKTINPITAFSVMQLIDRRRTASMLNYGDAFIAHSRNSCTDVFLQSDLEWMFTVDDDMLLPYGNGDWYRSHTGWNWLPDPFASFNTLDRLMSHGKTLVGALYFGRHRNGPPVYAEGSIATEAAYARSGPHDVVKPCNWVGTGAMLIHRSVFEDIEKKFPVLGRGADKKGGNWFTSSEHNLLQGVHDVYRMLTDDNRVDAAKALRATEMLDGLIRSTQKCSSLGMGEDVVFCRRAREAGHQPHVDMGLIAGHVGHCVYGPRNTGK